MKALLQLMAASAGALAVMTVPSCTSTCEEQGNCDPYSPDEPTGGTAGTSGTGGSTGGSAGTGATAGTASGGTAGKGGEGGDGSVGGEGGAGGEGGTGPDICDPSAPADGCIIGDPDGIYVAPMGDDNASGSKDAPLETITEAIAQAADTGRTIYVCNGAFDEHLEINDDGLVIRGGYECPSSSVAGWLYHAGERARVRPADPGYALRVTSVAGLTLSDLDLASRNAERPGESSVTVFVTASDDVSFERTRIVAGDGVNGDDGVRAGSNHFAMSLDGNAAVAASGGMAKPCMCMDGSTTTGALGGAGGLTPTPGAVGLPDYGMGGGARGEASTLTSACTNGGLGSPAPSRMNASGALLAGSVDPTNGWSPRAGGNGSNGQPGQGGGGGGGAGGLTSKGGGGGGACGGCGGLGGPGGTGGGGSIALLAVDSRVTVDASSEIETGIGGSGGSGVSGEEGQGGGTRGGPDGNGCLGGTGGKGATGGAGGGGAGGVSVGILSQGGMITADGVTFTIGDAGGAGQGGGADNDGVEGTSANVLEL